MKIGTYPWPLLVLIFLHVPQFTFATSAGAPWTPRQSDGPTIGPGGAISKVSRNLETKRSLLFKNEADRPPPEIEDLYVTKRDGRRELIDKKKVRMP